MIRTVLVDDEAPALDRLGRLLETYPDIEVVAQAQDGFAALTTIEEKKPDLVFLDIEMPELNGLGVAQTLGLAGQFIVFATAYEEHALKAFEANAIDYIVKPINSARLAVTVEKIRRSLATGSRPVLNPALASLAKHKSSRLAIKLGAKYEVFDPESISIAVAKDHYTSLVVDGRELLCDDSLEAVHARLDPELFIRIHRSAVVNIRFLKALKREGDRKYRAVLNDEARTQVPISRERLPQVKALFGLG